MIHDRLIASKRHTVILVAIFVMLGIAGGWARNAGAVESPPANHDLVPLYISVLVSEWALVWYVWSGIRRNGVTLGDLIGGRWDRALGVYARALEFVALGARQCERHTRSQRQVLRNVFSRPRGPRAFHSH